MKPQIGFVGVGAMGAGIVMNLAKAGFPVTFFARNTTRGDAAAQRLIAVGAQRAPDLGGVARGAAAVILCLPDSPAVEAVLSDDAGIVGQLPEGALVIDCSTSLPESTRRLAQTLAKRDVTMLDAPLTGTPRNAAAGTVSVFGAGPREAFERARPIFGGFAKHIFYLGPTGAGHTAKLINNFFGQLALAGLCETWGLIDRANIDPQALFDAISVSGGNSALFQGAFARLRARDFGLSFAQALVRKDVRYINEVLKAAGLPVLLAERLLAVHDAATGRGYGDRDFSSLLEFYEELAAEGKTPNAAPGRQA